MLLSLSLYFGKKLKVNKEPDAWKTYMRWQINYNAL